MIWKSSSFGMSIVPSPQHSPILPIVLRAQTCRDMLKTQTPEDTAQGLYPKLVHEWQVPSLFPWVKIPLKQQLMGFYLQLSKELNIP